MRMLGALGFIARILGGVLLVTALLFALIVLFPSSVSRTPLGIVQWAHGIERALAVWVRGYLPLRLVGLSHWIVIIAVLVLSRALLFSSERYRDRIEYL